MPRKKKSKPSVKYPEANPLEGILLREEPVPFNAETPGRGVEGKTELTKLTELKSQSEKNSDNPVSKSPRLTPAYSDPAHGIYLYQNNCLAVLDAIAAKYPEGRFDMIFADPPYFLSNGGITCHAGKMVAVHKGDWDKSQGAEENHNFNREWLLRCQRVLKPNGTIWVSGTHHVIFSVGFAMQQLGFKILNDIAWEKPNPPPNLSCRYFTHSTETILWAAKGEKSKHLFNYQEMRKVTGKQMKTVWRAEEFRDRPHPDPLPRGEGVSDSAQRIPDASRHSPSPGGEGRGEGERESAELCASWPRELTKSKRKRATQLASAPRARCWQLQCRKRGARTHKFKISEGRTMGDVPLFSRRICL